MSFLTKIKAASITIKNETKAKECVQYILDTEYEDFSDYVKDNHYEIEDWKHIPHIYVDALQAAGLEPDKTLFAE